MLGMGQTAVRAGNGSYTVKLPVKAPERFTAKAFLLDANSAPLCECYVLDRSGQYSITGLTVADGQSAASVSAGADCQLMLRFLSDDGQDDLGTLYAPVESGAETVTADLPQDLSLPANFRVEAALKNSGGQTLGEPYLCLRYTSAYQKTAEDYPKERVLDFEEEGFAVLNEDVKRAGTATETAGGYSVDMPILPAVGDVVALTIDGATVPVKVGSASMAGGKTVIVPDENATLADLYDVLRVDGTIDIKPGGAEQSVQLYSGDDLGDKKRGLPLLANGSVTIVPNLSLTFEGQMALKYQFFYDKAVDPDYFEKELVVEGQGTITLANGAEAGTDNKTGGVEVTVMESPGIALGTTGLEADLKLSIPLSFSVGAGDTVIWEYDLCEGVGYQAGLGHRWVSRSKNVVKNTAQKAGCSASIGFQGSLEVGSVGGLIPLKASLGLQSGVRYTNELKMITSTTGSERHACQLCMEQKVTGFQELNASIACELKHLTIPITKFALPLVEKTVLQRYHSFENDVDSPFGGQPATGEGECPNKQYLVTVNARDLSNNEVKNASLTVKRKDTGKVMAEGASPGACWLYNGKYTASAVINGRTFEKDFTVSNAPQTVDIKEAKTTLRVTVTDKDTSSPLSGVRVSCTDITNPGSQPQVGDETTNKNGLCFFRVNPGQYTLAITAEDYDNTTRQVTVANEDEIPVDVPLPRTEAYASLTVYLIDKTTQQPVAGNITLSVTGSTVPLASASNGVAEMKHLIPGDYTVTVPATGGYAPASKTITLAPGQEGTLTIELLGETGTLTGTVKDSGAKAIFGATVTATNADGDAISTTTDLNGAYTLTLAPGSYTVKASASGYASQSATATVVKDQTATQDLTLKATEGEGWSFDEATGTLTISGSGPMTSYSSDKDVPWYSLRENVTSVKVEDGVTSIGAYAFENCTSLISVAIPDSVTVIGYRAFYSCANLTSIDIPSGVTDIGQTAFSGCSSLTNIDIPIGVASIGGWTFNGCTSLTDIYIPSSVTDIGSAAFANCTSLTSIDIPSSVSYINGKAFMNCSSLTSIIIPGNVWSIGSYAFSGCSSLTSIDIPDGVRSIYEYTFQNCSSLTNITIPDSVKAIARYAFNGCNSLPGIVIPGGVTSIGVSAFEGCSRLTSVDIPSGVKSIEKYTFRNCTSLTGATIPSSVNSIGESAFSGCSSLPGINIPDGVTSIGVAAFSRCSSLTSVNIPGGVTWIGSSAFSGCSNLTSATIQSGVTFVADSMFSGCSGLTSVIIPDSVTSIRGGAFRDCSGLARISIPGSVTSIGHHAFSSCSSLTSVTIPSSVTSIGSNAFDRCSALTSISIPSGVTSIESGTFSASGLTSITIPNSVTSIGANAFQDCSGLTDIIISNSVTSIEYGTFYGCSSLTNITIPNSVTTIGQNAFSSCSSLTSITIPSNVTSIGSGVFTGCTNLATVYYGGTQDQWDALKVTLPASATLICAG